MSGATLTGHGTPHDARGRMILGRIRDFQRNPLGFIERVARCFRLRPSPEGRRVEAQALATLRPRGGLWMMLHEARQTTGGGARA